MKVCHEIVDRQCRGPATTFGRGVGTVAFYTRVEGATGDAFVEHVWKREGKVVRRSRVSIKGGSYRAWTTKYIAGQTGGWNVEVLDPVGRSLGQLDFKVEKSPGAAEDQPEETDAE